MRRERRVQARGSVTRSRSSPTPLEKKRETMGETTVLGKTLSRRKRAARARATTHPTQRSTSSSSARSYLLVAPSEFGSRPPRSTHDGEILGERDGGELLLRGSHELRGDLLGVGRGVGRGGGRLDAASGEGAGHGRLVEGKRKRHLTRCSQPGGSGRVRGVVPAQFDDRHTRCSWPFALPRRKQPFL